MMANRRPLFWGAFLSLAGAIALGPELFFEEGPSPSSVAPAPLPEHRGELAALRSSAAPAAQPGASEVPLSVPQADLFAVHSWYVAPPPPPAPRVTAAPPPPAPSAPALPFRFLGRLDDSQAVQVFLQQGDRLHSVRVGDVIENTYRVERIQAAQMILTYLPLQVSQSLPVGSEP